MITRMQSSSFIFKMCLGIDVDPSGCVLAIDGFGRGKFENGSIRVGDYVVSVGA